MTEDERSIFMNSRFTKGLMLGSIIGTSLGMIMNPDMLSGRSRRKAMRTGKRFLRNSGHVIGNVVDMFR